MLFAVTWMDLEIVILNEVSQKFQYPMILLICGMQKNGTNEIIYKTEFTDIENKTHSYQGGQGGWETLGDGTDMQYIVTMDTLYKTDS